MDAHLSRSLKDAVGRIAELERRTSNLPARWARPGVPPKLVLMQVIEWMLPAPGTPGSGPGSSFPTFFIAKCAPYFSTPLRGAGSEVYVETIQDHAVNGSLWATKPTSLHPLNSVQIDNASPPTLATASWLEFSFRAPLRAGVMASDWVPGSQTIQVTPANGYADIPVSLISPYQNTNDVPAWCGWRTGLPVPYFQSRGEDTIGSQFVAYANPLPRTTSIGHVLQNTRAGSDPWYQMQAFTLY